MELYFAPENNPSTALLQEFCRVGKTIEAKSRVHSKDINYYYHEQDP